MQDTIFGDVLNHLEAFLSLFSTNHYVQALFVILISLVVAKLTDFLITRGIFRLARRTQSDVDDRLISLLHRPIFVTMVLFGLMIAVGLTSPSPYFRGIATNIVQSLIVLMWIVFGVRVTTILIGWVTHDVTRFRAIQPATRPLFETGAKITIIALGIYFVLISWGVDPVGWLATAGIAAVAVGLAAQETLGNLFAGISILADAPYKIGDYIVLEGQERGKVTKIGLRSTRILTRDDLEITIPNAAIARSQIINETSGRWIKQRLRVPVGVAYGSNPEQVCQLLEEAANAQDGVCQTPPAWVKFDGFGDSALQFEIRCWIEEASRRGRITSAIHSAVYRILGEHEIEIPYPKRDVYIKELPERIVGFEE